MKKPKKLTAAFICKHIGADYIALYNPWIARGDVVACYEWQGTVPRPMEQIFDPQYKCMPFGPGAYMMGPPPLVAPNTKIQTEQNGVVIAEREVDNSDYKLISVYEGPELLEDKEGEEKRTNDRLLQNFQYIRLLGVIYPVNHAADIADAQKGMKRLKIAQAQVFTCDLLAHGVDSGKLFPFRLNKDKP